MRRLAWGLGISIGVELFATAAFFIVSYVDSSSWLIYVIGALTVIPLPVALVFMMIMMYRALQD